MVTLRLCVLGPYQVLLDDHPVKHFESTKVRALLTYLAVEPDRPYSREFLADLLWSDNTRTSALGNLRYTISSLRKNLKDQHTAAQISQPSFITANREYLQFNKDSPASADMWEFSDLVRRGRLGSSQIECLDKAVSLYRGEFLEGFSLPDSAGFEEWLLLKREHYRRQMLKCLYRLANYYESVGDYELAQRYAWKQVEMEPWLEEGYQQLMRALAISGQRSAALAQFETCRRLLSDELGIEPSSKTLGIYEAIRDDSIGELLVNGPQRALIANQIESISLPAAERQRAESHQPPFYGFRQEIAYLESHLEQAVSGQGKVIFIAGDPGSGKTSLARELARLAMLRYPELVVANSSCSPPAGLDSPCEPFVEILHSLTCTDETHLLSGVYSAHQVSRLRSIQTFASHILAEGGLDLTALQASPLLHMERAGSLYGYESGLIPKQPGNSIPAHQHRDVLQPTIFEQYCYVLVSIARSYPLLLILDNLQWADHSTTSLLYHIGKRLFASPILILALYRPGDLFTADQRTNHPLEQVIQELTTEFGELNIDLNNADGRSFVSEYLDSSPNRYPEHFQEGLFQTTRGHPLFTIELLDGLHERGDIYKDESGYWIASDHPDWNTITARAQAVIEGHFNHLPEKWMRFLQAASLEGELFTAELAALLVGIENKRAIHWLSGPLSNQLHLVESVGFERLSGEPLSTYRFSHPLYQKYLYFQMDMAERACLHELSAISLKVMFPNPPEQIIERILWHRQQAGLPEISPAQ